ncbi:hypothetical protein STRIP9103_08271 [Streptomyces ipomoeae 91-03]|uniref:Uncharacterized protein n=1 Tax=Streptomyces ipomoeae 91-03 TaxID=698759 RepID=L1L3Y5_9ACTN|nr:hypothetical protein STRIP9103_08271 [Streptomyces ipomoeae 91-03]
MGCAAHGAHGRGSLGRLRRSGHDRRAPGSIRAGPSAPRAPPGAICGTCGRRAGDGSLRPFAPPGSAVERRWGTGFVAGCGFVVACRAHAAEPQVDTAPRP